MRISRYLKLMLISALIGGAALLYAQDEKPQEEHPQQDEAKPPKQDHAQPPRPDEGKPERQDEAKPQHQENKPDQMHENAAPERQDHPDQQGGRAGQDEQRPNQQTDSAHRADGRGNEHGGRIPDDQFRAHFGRGHHFRAQGVIVAGQPNFQYSGYTFELAQPWPGGWAYTDDCYIDYIDGEYYLIDLSHSDVRLALIVMM